MGTATEMRSWVASHASSHQVMSETSSSSAPVMASVAAGLTRRESTDHQWRTWLSRTTALNVPLHSGAVEILLLRGGHGDALERVPEGVRPRRRHETRDDAPVLRDLDLLASRNVVEQGQDLRLRFRGGHPNGHAVSIAVLLVGT